MYKIFWNKKDLQKWICWTYAGLYLIQCNKPDWYNAVRYYSIAVNFWKFLGNTKTNSKNISLILFRNTNFKKSVIQMFYCIYNIWFNNIIAIYLHIILWLLFFFSLTWLKYFIPLFPEFHRMSFLIPKETEPLIRRVRSQRQSVL